MAAPHLPLGQGLVEAMTTVQVGDTVQWQPKHQSKKMPKTLTGEVRKLHGGRKPWAAVWVDMVDKPGFWCVDLNRLTRIDHAPVASSATVPADTTARHADEVAVAVDDVEAAMRWAGSLT